MRGAVSVALAYKQVNIGDALFYEANKRIIGSKNENKRVDLQIINCERIDVL